MKTLFKILVYLLLLILVVLAAAALLLRYSPKVAINAADALSPYSIETKDLSVRLFPLFIEAQNLRVQTPEKQDLLEMESVLLRANWKSLMNGSHGFWFTKMQGGEIDLTAMPANTEQSTSSESTAPIHLHKLLAILKCDIENVSIKIDEQSSLQIGSFKTERGAQALLTAQQAAQDLAPQKIDAKLIYSQDGIPLELDGQITTQAKQGKSVIQIHFDKIILPGSEAEQELSDDFEPPLDWGWMQDVEDSEINLSIADLRVANSQIKNLAAKLELQGSTLKLEADSDLFSMSVGDAWSFAHPLSLIATLEPLAEQTRGADVKGEVQLKLPNAGLQSVGELNLNGIEGNKLSFAVDAYTMLLTPDQEQIQLAEYLDHYFPITFSGDWQVDDGDQRLDGFKLKAGNSDLSGSVLITSVLLEELNNGQKQPLHLPLLEADLVSKQWIVPLPQSNDEGAPETDEVSPSLFDDAPLELEWLMDFYAKLNLNMQRLQLHRSLFDNLELKANLEEGVLNIAPLQGDAASGEVYLSAELRAKQPTPSFTLEFDASQVQMEQTHLLPEESEIQGGVLNAKLSLASQGDSAQAMANNLKGSVLLNVVETSMANGSINLIGGDLLVELVNKLNPFLKSDSRTEIICTVANAEIADGVMEFKKSLVMETDKMAIVSGGKVNLGANKLDLSFTPKAHNGIGLNTSSLVKFLKIGGQLDHPELKVSGLGLLETGAALGAAVSTGGASVLVDSFMNKKKKGASCEHALNAFQQTEAPQE